jgi:hypothetical protein
VEQYGGFILVIEDAERIPQLRRRVDEGRAFTEALSCRDWKAKGCEIFLISFGDDILHLAAIGRIKQRAVTGKHRVEFCEFVKLPTISLGHILRNIDQSIRDHLTRSTRGGGGRVSPSNWQEIIGWLGSASDEIRSALARLDDIRKQSGVGFKSPAYQVIAEERDAIGVCADLAGFDRRDLMHSVTIRADDAPKSPFESLPVRIFEDQIVQHDSSVFEGWTRVRPHMVGGFVFRQGKRLLSVANVNRHPIENTLGVDLIYYHHHCESFVMVQYKRFNGGGRRNCGYRPDDQCRAEQRRMEAFLKANPDMWPADQPSDYRLNPCPFYFKLCPETLFEPASTSLMPGMYLPLDLWQAVNASSSSRGPKSGVRITYDNVPRRLNNSIFARLVQAGLIGSRGVTTKKLRALIEGLLVAKHSVVVSECTGPAEPWHPIA